MLAAPNMGEVVPLVFYVYGWPFAAAVALLALLLSLGSDYRKVSLACAVLSLGAYALVIPSLVAMIFGDDIELDGAGWVEVTVRVFVPWAIAMGVAWYDVRWLKKQKKTP